jgi:hypothetical protein
MRFNAFCDALSSTVCGTLISRFVVISILPILFGITHPGHADDTETKESPWILIPTLSVDPKLGTSFGVMGGYIHQFDPLSTPSMFIATTAPVTMTRQLQACLDRCFSTKIDKN